MKRAFPIRPWPVIGAGCFLLGLIVTGCTSGNSTDTATDSASITPATNASTSAPSADETVSVERGEHLVLVGGCNDCHSPKVMTTTGPNIDESRQFAGHPAGSPLPAVNVAALQPGNWINASGDLTAWVGPWGMSYSANISSDSATGIGAWSEQNFLDAMHTGKHMGLKNGRPIAPPMPWAAVGKLSDTELKSIFAYLKSTAPISNRVPEPLTPPQVMQLAAAKKAPATP